MINGGNIVKISKVVLSIALLGIVITAGVAPTAFAWHPKGTITKKVQNITNGGALSEADTASTAIPAKPGDTLKYVIEVRNDGAADSNGYNDMAKTVMTDTLPAGVTLVSSASQRQITENLGTIKPGQKVTKEYTVKVTSNIDGTIENTACFTGDSTANDNPQKGCNPAVVKVTVPVTPPPVVTTPETPVIPPVATPAPEAPVELPHTGMTENVIGSALALGLAFYAAYRYVQSRKELTKAITTIR
jgi:uncharacterized repeat protein (TIGR01451 family)